MKKILKRTFLVLLIAFVGIQFIPTTRNISDVVLDSDFIKAHNAPENLATLLQTSCYDCHSDNTNYPWYNKIQPVAWMLEEHVEEGKEELNFSTFGDLSSRKQKSKLKSIIGHINNGEMPLSSYTLIHSDAILSESEKSELDTWLNNLRDNL
ncbi:MAG: heme-binding domain-containing protein [Fluviicola sp.]|nr:heme-binding domain-containing protein [Fluviicola sp.]